jgi:hypothetical protein
MAGRLLIVAGVDLVNGLLAQLTNPWHSPQSETDDTRSPDGQR